VKYKSTASEIIEQIAARGANAVYVLQERSYLLNGQMLLLEGTREQLIKQSYKNYSLLHHYLDYWCKENAVAVADSHSRGHNIEANNSSQHLTTP
jgi:hypothetical protein